MVKNETTAENPEIVEKIHFTSGICGLGIVFEELLNSDIGDSVYLKKTAKGWRVERLNYWR